MGLYLGFEEKVVCVKRRKIEMCGHSDIRSLNSNRIGRIRPELLANSLLAEDIAFDEVDGDDYLVFVYETLMNRKLRKALLQREVKFDIDEIEGYKEYAVETIEGDNYHTIISSEDDRVRGHVMHLTRDEMAVVDAWEDIYKRVTIKAKSGRDVFVYVLRISAIRDHGQNVSVELNDDDIAMLKDAEATGEYVLGKKNPDKDEGINRLLCIANELKGCK